MKKILLGLIVSVFLFVGVSQVFASPVEESITRTLMEGMKGSDVTYLQSYLGIPSDGFYGKQTIAKVKEWQTSNSLIADGIFGPASILKLKTLKNTGSVLGATTGSCVINSFTVTPSTVTSGAPMTLAWDTSGCGALSITGLGTVTGPSGSKVINPTYSSGYGLIAMWLDGVNFSNQSVSFTVTAAAPTNVIPTVASPTSSSVAQSTAVLGADLYSLGIPASVSSRGICYSTSLSSLTLSTGKCISASGNTTGTYSVSVSGLTPQTNYYFKGYATNATGTAYSSTGSFATLSAGPTAIDGGWTTWANSGSCVSGSQLQTRTCTNPAPLYGGAPCAGSSTQSISCAVVPVEPVEGKWTDWVNSGSCVKSADGLTSYQKQTRSCYDPNNTGLRYSCPAGAVTQNVSCGVTPIPKITVTYPNGGQTFTAGQQVTVQWKTENIPTDKAVFIALVDDLGKSFEINNSSNSLNDGSETVIIPTSIQSNTKYKISIENAYGSVREFIDYSDNTFTIQNPSSAQCTISSFTVSPSTIVKGQSATISWNTSNCGTLSIASLGVVSGPSGSKVVYPTVNTGYALIAMAQDGKSAINSDTKMVTVTDDTTPSITVTYPNGGQTFTAGQQITVKWTTKNISPDSSMDIALFKNYTLDPRAGTIVVAKNSGQETITLPYNFPEIQTGSDMKIRVAEIQKVQGTAFPSDYSDNPFTITSPTTTFVNDYACGLPLTEKLESNMSGGQVNALQKILNGLGYLSSTSVDGKFGAATYNAVIAYQTAKGLSPDGIVGTGTRASLNSKWAEKCVGGSNTVIVDLKVNGSDTPSPVTADSRLNVTWNVSGVVSCKPTGQNLGGWNTLTTPITGTTPAILSIGNSLQKNYYSEIYKKDAYQISLTCEDSKGVIVRDSVTIPITTIDSSGVDLQIPIGETFFPKNVKLGISTPFKAIIRNLGNTPVPTQFYNHFELTTCASTVNCDIINLPSDIKGQPSATFKETAGEMSAFYTFNKTGTFNVRACADQISLGKPDQPGNITESNEDNNCSSWVPFNVANEDSVFTNDYACGASLSEKLESNMSGGQVNALQKILNGLGYLNSTSVDGVFGPATYNAVKAYQTRYGLTVDGIVGAGSRASLNTKWAEKCVGGANDNKSSVLNVCPSQVAPVTCPPYQTEAVKDNNGCVIAFKCIGTAKMTNEISSSCPVKVAPITCPPYQTEAVKDINGCITAYKCLSSTTVNTTEPDCLSGYIYSPRTGKLCPIVSKPLSSTPINTNLTTVNPNTSNSSTTSDVLTSNVCTSSLSYGQKVEVGSTGTQVEKLQEILNELGYLNPYTTNLDGHKFGTETESAVKAFQKANNLWVDGIAGTNTINALNAKWQTKCTGKTTFPSNTNATTVNPNTSNSSTISDVLTTNSCSPKISSITNLEIGMDNDQVKVLQEILNELGYLNPYTTNLDGHKFGTETESAVKAFQKDNNLMIDGVVGMYTRGVINAKWQTKCSM